MQKGERLYSFDYHSKLLFDQIWWGRLISIFVFMQPRSLLFCLPNLSQRGRQSNVFSREKLFAR